MEATPKIQTKATRPKPTRVYSVGALSEACRNLKPGEWFEWSNKAAARSLLHYMKSEGIADVSQYAHPEKPFTMIVVHGDVPKEERERFEIMSGPAPERKPSRTRKSKFTETLLACEPGQWFLVSESERHSCYSAASHLKRRKKIDFKSFRIRDGRYCVIRLPSPEVKSDTICGNSVASSRLA